LDTQSREQLLELGLAAVSVSRGQVLAVINEPADFSAVRTTAAYLLPIRAVKPQRRRIVAHDRCRRTSISAATGAALWLGPCLPVPSGLQ
jgi:hypothetical protein